MKLQEATAQFVESWGALGSNWGINKTMAQIHALLLVSAHPQSAEDVMDVLAISRGNANMNLRALIDWGLVYKQNKLGERKEFFVAEKDIWKVATRIASERRKRELAPLLGVLEHLKDIDDSKAPKEEIKEFEKMTADIDKFSKKVDKIFGKLERADEHWFTGSLLKMMR